jgi:DNA-binding winged helix-turn-helix (wHTH) protein
MREFSPFRLDTTNQCLWRRSDSGESERILLTPKAFSVLSHLVDHAGRLVTQNELLEAVWPDTFVQPEVLKYQIADIRALLGDSARQPSFIETVPRRGYRFVAPVREVKPQEQTPIEPLESRLVGRQHEVSALWQALGRALQGERQLIFITGEPGIGKTALVEEFAGLASAAERSLRIAQGQTVGGEAGSEAYYPVLVALGQLCRGGDSSALVEILAKHAPTWLVQFPALLKPEHRETLQTELLGATRNRMLREIREALDAFTAENPVLYVYEDVHWVDPATVDLLSAYAQDKFPAKTMVIITMRSPEFLAANHPLKRAKQDLLLHDLALEISLGPLSEPDVAAYLKLDAAAALPAGLAELVFSRSEGNPLFMRTFLKLMVQKGQISLGAGIWELKMPLEQIDFDVPETLRQLTEAQIELLTMEEQHALEAASVAGTSFPVHLVADAMRLDMDRTLELFDALSRRSCFIRTGPSLQLPSGSAAQVFEFVHALYREVFYTRQTPARRSSLQRRMGEQRDKPISGRATK